MRQDSCALKVHVRIFAPKLSLVDKTKFEVRSEKPFKVPKLLQVIVDVRALSMGGKDRRIDRPDKDKLAPALASR
jgi:hypothetical protein